MKLKYTLFAALLFTGTATAFAQHTEKAQLSNLPVAAAVSDSTATAKPEAPKTVLHTQKRTSFSLTAGTMFSNYGMASYISPSVYYKLNNKFSVFSSLTYINSNFNTCGGTENRIQPMATKNYLLHVGGTYDVNDRLRISGSVWRDFRNFNAASDARFGFRQPARYGADFQARYKVSENITIFGGIRTSSGNGYDPYNRFFAPSPGMGF